MDGRVQNVMETMGKAISKSMEGFQQALQGKV